MTEIFSLAALWLGLALIATLLSIWLRIATAMSEIVVGTVTLIANAFFLPHHLLKNPSPPAEIVTTGASAATTGEVSG